MSYYEMLDICSSHNGLDPMQVMKDYPKINFDDMTIKKFKKFLQQNY